VLDGITDTDADELITPDELAGRLTTTRILFIGEDHTDMDFHRVQYRVIEALHRAGREVHIGLEMFPYSQQDALNQWSRGELTDDQFLDTAGWYKHWSYRWEYYRDIFWFARDNQIPMYGINAPRKVIRQVRTDGFEALDEKDARHIPMTVDTDSEQHRRLFRAYFEESDALHADLSDEQWEGMFRAQCTWDAVMGWNALQAVEENGGPDAIMVVLIGAGHVAYGLGAERQISSLTDGDIASLLPVPVRNGDGTPVSIVQRSYADFIWGIPQETEPHYPVLGISVAGMLGDEPTRIIQVSEDSVAEQAGIAVDDVLISMDGKQIDSSLSLRKHIATYEWGDRAKLELRRGDEEITLDVAFRRQGIEQDVP